MEDKPKDQEAVEGKGEETKNNTKPAPENFDEPASNGFCCGLPC